MTSFQVPAALFGLFLCILFNAYPSLAAPAAKPAHALNAAPALGDAVGRILHEEQLAGATWTLVEHGKIVTGAAGSSNVRDGISMQPGNRVHIGSVTKTVLAVGLLRLATQGRLDLDAPVDTVLPGLGIQNPWSRTDPVRVRHLMDHTAGLEDLRLRQVFSGQVGPRDELKATFGRHRGLLRVRTRPGQIFSYSNIGYTLAGMIVERVTGQRYERWLDENLLAPLEMKESTFEFVSQAEDPDFGLAWGHNDDLSLAPALPVALRPGAQFTTTAQDMGRLVRFLMSDGSIGGRPFVDRALLGAMGVPIETAAARAGLPLGYRFGLASRDRQGLIGKCHAGNIIGYRSQLCIYPEEQKAFFYSINTDGESADYSRIDKAMTDMLRLSTQAAVRARQPAAEIDEWRGHYVPAVSGIGLERYTDWLAENLRFVPVADHALLEVSGGEPRRLDYVGGHLLRAADRIVPSHALLPAAPGGARTITDGLRTYRRVPELLLWGVWISLALGLAGLLHATVVLPVLGWWRRRSILQPMTFAAPILFAGAGLMYLQPFELLGDPTVGSFLLTLGSITLPVGAALQAFLALEIRPRFWLLDFVAALAVLQWSAVLALFGLLPLVLWA